MATAAVEFKIIEMRKMPSIDRTRLGQWDWLIVYELDATHRYTLMLPVETLTEDTMKAAVKADVQERAKWLNRPFRV